MKQLLVGGETYTLSSARRHKGNILLKLAEITSLTAAEKLRGQEVFSVKRPADNRIFQEDIIGKEVIDRGNRIGTVTDIMQSPAHDILVIARSAHAAALLVPLIPNFVKEISDTIQADLSGLEEA